jgi:23S rRNA (cytidine2498-2'-O)-methyltransferase
MTSSPDAASAALSEVESADPGARLRAWLAPGVGWLELGMDWDGLVDRFRERPPIFCRHVCPVQATLPIAQREADLDALAEAGEQLVPRLDVVRSFSVQTRLLGQDWPYGRYDVNEKLSAALVERGAPLDVRQPDQVLSVVLAPAQGYLGLSLARDNLSDWAGGARRFKREKGQISRAEFKLLEAVELFGLRLPVEGLALDLGAAPGGWTRILRQGGLRVVAVDPADLDPRLARDRAIRHVRQTAQRYLHTADQCFDAILNDMRTDARDAARLLAAAADRLKEDGWALTTLKLSKRGMVDVAAYALQILRERYDIIGARQLFHNRNEITAALRRRS